MMTFKAPAAVFAALSVIALSDAGHAGQSYSAGASCSTTSNGSGYCSGSLSGFLASADANAYAAFWNEGATYGVFVAELDGNYYSCTTTSPAEPWFALSAAPPTTSFSISWTSAGTCSVLWMEAGSQYK
ncbi:MAG TPA: hypothetical protein VMI75_26935 [Polyangiaceae bacterium]|nr:hypothetical protein [Polyangiaceae bacterium]